MVFEVIICKRVYFSACFVISAIQHDFMKSRSTGNRQHIDAVYIGFSKAFDKIKYQYLLIKLRV